MTFTCHIDEVFREMQLIFSIMSNTYPRNEQSHIRTTFSNVEHACYTSCTSAKLIYKTLPHFGKKILCYWIMWCFSKPIYVVDYRHVEVGVGHWLCILRVIL